MSAGFDLWRAIDAEGGSGNSEYDAGHRHAIERALMHVERLGYREGLVTPAAEEAARLQRERDVAVRWANQSVESLKEAFFAIVEAVADADADDAISTIKVDLPHGGFPRQWLRDAARRALNRDPYTNREVLA